MSWVHDHIFAAGGNEIPKTWQAFQDQTGIDAVVHLSPGAPTAFVGPSPGAFLWLDIADESGADTAARLLAGGFVLDCLRDGRNVLLHSRIGRHRTRWVFVAFLLCGGTSLASALRQAEARPWLAPYRTDETSWQRVVDWMNQAGGR